MGERDVLDAGDFRARRATWTARSAREDACLPVGSMTIDEIEKAMIVKSMQPPRGNVTQGGRGLGLSRAALYRRFEKYEIPGVSLRARFIAYLIAVHALMAATAVLLVRQFPVLAARGRSDFRHFLWSSAWSSSAASFRPRLVHRGQRATARRQRLDVALSRDRPAERRPADTRLQPDGGLAP